MKESASKMSNIPIIDDFCNWLSNEYVDLFYIKSPEIITKRKIIDIQIKQIEASEELGDQGLGGRLLNQYTLDDILDKWYEWAHKPDCIYFASYMLYNIAYQHPFYQGNKRTAFMTATLILGCCGKSLEGGKDEIIKFVKEVAQGNYTLQEVTEWVGVHTFEESGHKKLMMILVKFGTELVVAENIN